VHGCVRDSCLAARGGRWSGWSCSAALRAAAIKGRRRRRTKQRFHSSRGPMSGLRQRAGPLHAAAFADFRERVGTLLQRGANPDGRVYQAPGILSPGVETKPAPGRGEPPRTRSAARRWGEAWPCDLPWGSTMHRAATTSVVNAVVKADFDLNEAHKQTGATPTMGSRPTVGRRGAPCTQGSHTTSVSRPWAKSSFDATKLHPRN
jgi:hypothetical protein